MACGALGVDTSAITFFGVEDGALEREQESVEDALVAELGTGQFDEVYVPSPDDAHADHRALFAAAVRAVAREYTDRRAGLPGVVLVEAHVDRPLRRTTRAAWRTTGPDRSPRRAGSGR